MEPKAVKQIRKTTTITKETSHATKKKDDVTVASSKQVKVGKENDLKRKPLLEPTKVKKATNITRTHAETSTKSTILRKAKEPEVKKVVKDIKTVIKEKRREINGRKDSEKNVNRRDDKTEKKINEEIQEDTPSIRIRSRSRTLSPSEIKLVRGPMDVSPKGSIVSMPSTTGMSKVVNKTRVKRFENEPKELAKKNVLTKTTRNVKGEIEKEKVKNDGSKLAVKGPKMAVGKTEVQERSSVGKRVDETATEKAPILTVTSTKDAVSPNLYSSLNSDPSEQVSENDPVSYEDDFESYESDFEEYTGSERSLEQDAIEASIGGDKSNAVDVHDDTDSTSDSMGDVGSIPHSLSSDTETSSDDLPPVTSVQVQIKAGEDRKLDSGNYEIRLRQGLFAKPETNDDVKETSLDEGFVENGAKRGFKLDFVGAINQSAKERNLERIKRRANDVLSMITLDVVKIDVFEMIPVPYDVYMKSYGSSGTTQTSCQTNDDSYDEEIQTDDIPMMSKYTQYPISLNDENIQPIDVQSNPTSTNERNLKVFLEKSTKLMFNELETEPTSDTLQFEDPGINGVSSQSFKVQFPESLADREVVEVQILDGKFVYTLHKKLDTGKDSTTTEDPVRDFDSLICLWKVFSFSTPLVTLTAHGDVRTFACDEDRFVFAGLANGLLCVWDLNEDETNHPHVDITNPNSPIRTEYPFRTPSFITSASKANVSEIVTIKCFPEEATRVQEICVLTSLGELSVWSVVDVQSFTSSTDGLAPWAQIKLVPSLRISVLDYLDLDARKLTKRSWPSIPETDEVMFVERNVNGDGVLCCGFIFDAENSNHVYVATNLGIVIHVCVLARARWQPKVYEANDPALIRLEFTGSEQSPVVTICAFPMKKPYFLVGTEDGNLRVHHRRNKKPLFTDHINNDVMASLKIAKWIDPCVIYSIDCADVLRVWDLTLGQSLAKSTAMALSGNVLAVEFLGRKFMVVSSCNGVEIHKLHDDQLSQVDENTKSSISDRLDAFEKCISLL